MSQTGVIETVRVDAWLWAVRVYKTRSLSASACRAGHVRINGKPAKAASPVRVGDRVTTRAGERDRDVEAVLLLDKRVSPELAADCIVDHSPPVEREPFEQRMFERARGAGRPTKKDRRQLERFRNRG